MKIDLSITKIKKEALKHGVTVVPCKASLINGEKCWKVQETGVLYTRKQLVLAYFADELY